MDIWVYHTPDDQYSRHALACKQSFAPWVGLGLQLLPLGKTWIETCMARPRLLAERASLLQPYAGIGLMDADLRCVRRPDALLAALLDNHWDVLVDHRGEDARPRDRWSAQLVCFRNLRGRKVLDRWAELCERDPNPEQAIREQFYLGKAMEEVKPSYLNLHGAIHVPPRDWDGTIPPEAEMCHVPASRDIEGTPFLNDRL